MATHTKVDSAALLQKLKDLHIEVYSLIVTGFKISRLTTFEHPPAKTVVEHASYLPIDGGRVKNLLLRGKRSGRLVLVCALTDTEVNLKKLQTQLGLHSKDLLRFASEELLISHLGVPEGSVTPFAVINDPCPNPQVELIIDPRMLACEAVHIHPMRCDATTTIRMADLQQFWKHLGREYKLLE